jgi:hypothetical protein
MLGPNAERDARAVKWEATGTTTIYFPPDWRQPHVEEFAKLVQRLNPPPAGHQVKLVSLPAIGKTGR